MEDIKKTFTIQWVGPFSSLQELQTYTEDNTTCDSGLFNFYYFVGKRKEKWSRSGAAYFGIHHNDDGIMNRLKAQHEHLAQFREDENLKIWIGSFADVRNQTYPNIEDVETVFIRAYKDLLTDNKRKKSLPLSNIKESVCIINLWYKPDEQPWKRKPLSVKGIDDVLICEVDSQHPRILTASLKNQNLE
jgi:hypothetical protein